jgi:hypothetical protein
MSGEAEQQVAELVGDHAAIGRVADAQFGELADRRRPVQDAAVQSLHFRSPLRIRPPGRRDG